MADRQPLISEPSDLPDATPTPVLPSLGFTRRSYSLESISQIEVSPQTSPRRSPRYSRVQSDISAVDRNTPPTVHEEDERDITDSLGGHSFNGLGIAAPALRRTSNRSASIQSVTRVPVGAKRLSAKSPSLKSFEKSGFSPGDSLFGSFSDESPGSTPDLSRDRCSPGDRKGGFGSSQRGVPKNGKPVDGGLHPFNYHHDYTQSTDTPELHRGSPSVSGAYENGFQPIQECPTAKDFYISRFSWVSVTILLICLFSTVFSGLFLGLAIKGPRYGRSITSQGNFKPSDAIVLTSVMAKLIELSFVTAFVAFLGQVLSRRAFMKEHGRGVTLSELSMWRWVVQPGTLITHWETARYAGVTVLGILSLLSATLATLYAPAATAVVQPILKEGRWENKVLAALVQTDFANVDYVKSLCESPIRTDKVHGRATCLQIEHAGQGYHNYQRYLSQWNTAIINENVTSDQHQRPPGFGLLHENTTITGQWVSVVNTTAVARAQGRVINNVSLAIPHSGVFQAARDHRNDIMQPEELNSEGTYSLRASVPSPVVHVLCANMNEEELAPIIYDKWNDDTVTGTTWASLQGNATTTNTTVVDDLFGWTKSDPKRQDYPPVFARLPIAFNTILNHTNAGYGRGSIYLLGQGGKDDGSDGTGIYVLCKMHLSITSDCSTRYDVAHSGGSMEAHCEDEEDEMAYRRSNPDALEISKIANWMDIGFDWSNSLSLNTGIDDANASNSRLMTQLIMKPSNPDPQDLHVQLNDRLPSVAEALAVMSASTLLKSMQDAPYVLFWNYTTPALETPVTQYFKASLKAQQYASGGADEVSKGWIVILFLVFLMNVFVLIYFLLHHGLVTDFSEPPNLFALAVNSPPSHLFAGSCGGGPEGKQYTVNWFVNAEGDHLYIEPGAKSSLGDHVQAHVHSHPQTHHHPQPYGHPHVHRTKAAVYLGAIANKFYNLRDRYLRIRQKQSQTRHKPVNMAGTSIELEDTNTRTQRQYRMLAKRRSLL